MSTHPIVPNLTHIVEQLRAETAPRSCPECSRGWLQISDATVSEEFHPGMHTVGQPLPRRQRIGIAVFCDACEFSAELFCSVLLNPEKES